MYKTNLRTRHFFLDQNMPAVKPLPLDLKNLSGWDRFKGLISFKRQWELIEDFSLSLPWRHMTVLVPKDFVFDFASVPKILWPVLSPTGVLLLGSVLHDFGYRYGGLIATTHGVNPTPRFLKLTKNQLDMLLAEISTAVSSSVLPGAAAVLGLKIGGWLAWNDARKTGKDATIDYAELLGT
jgi:hypothetical protein